MATSTSASSRRSAASSSASLRRSGGSGGGNGGDSGSGSHKSPSNSSSSHQPSMPIDTLVNHLLAAKRSLSSMNLVLRANDIANHARASHEDASLLAAQSGFMRTAILDQSTILVRLRRTLQDTYDWGKKDFRRLVRAMDEADGALEGTMVSLRATVVQSALRPTGEEKKKTLLDFVDEESVHGMREAMKKSIEELQGIQQSFDGDLLRFDTDIRNIKKLLSDAAFIPTTDTQSGEGQDENAESNISMTEHLQNMVEHSSSMAELLASLTNHFDMCVTAIRTTEGAVALARRKAAEVTQSQGLDGVSISGVIAEQESGSGGVSHLEPETARDRAEMLKVVVQDAGEVDDVVQEIHDRLAEVERGSDILAEQRSRVKDAYAIVLEAYVTLGDIGDRLADYMAAEEDFRQRWELEKDIVHGRLREMTELREFYDRYAGAYDSLILEVERRRSVDERIRAVWRKAQDSVDKIMEADQASRESFRHDVGEFLPTDLWEDMQGPARRWQVVPVDDEGAAGGAAASTEYDGRRRSQKSGGTTEEARRRASRDVGGEETPRMAADK